MKDFDEIRRNDKAMAQAAFEAFPEWISGLEDWTKGFTLTYKDKWIIPESELNGWCDYYPHGLMNSGYQHYYEEDPRVGVWQPTLKWVKKTMEEWQALQTYNGNKFIAILEKGKMGTERYHVHGISTGSIRHWGQGFHQEIDVSPAWVHYVSKYMLKDPLGFWSNI